MTPTPCPHCGAEIDCHDGVIDKRPPRSGDVSICAYCRNLSMFATGPHGLHLRKPTTAEYDEIANHPAVAAALHALALHPSAHAAAKAARGEQ